MTNLDHLNVISTICETGSFQRASEQLNKARSAVSYSVKQVEEHYQIKIFDRSNYRPQLTPEGKLLLTKIRQLLRQARTFESFVNDIKGENETELRLSISSIFPLRWLTGLLTSLRAEYPATTIHLDLDVASGERALLAENIDLAIFAAPIRNVSLDYKQIDTMDVPLLISGQLIAGNADDVTREELIQHPQVVVKSTDEQSPDVGLLDEAHKWFVTDLHAKKDLICSGLGWGRLPRHMVGSEIERGSLVALPLFGEISLPICVAKRAGFNPGPVAKHIWNYFDNSSFDKD